MAPEADDPDGETSFVDAFASLEESRTVLVVGSVSDTGSAMASRRLFGSPAPRRLQLLAYTHSPERASRTASNVDLVEFGLDDHDAPATAEGRERVTDGRLSTFGRTISDRIFEFERRLDGDASLDVRLCVDSLTDLLAAYDRETVFRFVRMMLGQVRNVRGVGQFHLPRRWDSDDVLRFAPLFDALVEVRTLREGHEFRWRFGGDETDRENPSEWRPL